VRLLAILLTLLALGAPPAAAAVDPVLPPTGTDVDYQLGGAAAPGDHVGIVVRDRTARPAGGRYNICYVNGFQTQPAEASYWLDLHPDLILRDAAGNVVMDPDWNEMLLDIRLAEQRAAISSIVGGWIQECRNLNYDAVELDRLDSFTRSQGLLVEQQAVYMMKLFADKAHAAGMAIAQKNAVELVPRKAELGTDFVITEECNRFSECDQYMAGYGDHVIVIEYRQQDFNAGCLAYPNLSIVLRDVNVVTPQMAGYVYDGC
jgi:hypothetical protein